ncbi:MAG: phage portal protein [Syntrophomonadaceae bacterium]|jgi:HK97 family phage portal protein|nr:phage portal protein [Syntrophomonadaceae bacterium]
MIVLDYLKNVFKGIGQERQYRKWLMNGVPLFTSFGKDIYLSDYVNNAIDRIASEISKIELKSIVQNGDVLKVQNDDITRLFRFKPNPLQTTSDFFSSVEWLRRKYCNAFIYPQYQIISLPDGRQFRKYIAFYPLKPQAVYIGENNGAVWEIRMDFEDGSSYTLPYADLIHLRWRRGANTIIGGGDDYGGVNNYDVLRTIDALDKTIQGLPKSIEASLQIKGVYHAKTLAEAQKLAAIRDDFESHITTSKSGIVATDLAGEFTPVNINAPEIPDAALKFLKSVIQERYGVSAAILSGDYNGDQHSAFYQTAIEDFIVQFEQAFTACVFTAREQDVGHRVKGYYSKINYMATQDKIQLANIAKETGIMMLNEINEMFGIPPFEGGNRRLQSLNYVNIEDVDAYQKGKAGVGDSKPKKEDDEEEEGRALNIRFSLESSPLSGVDIRADKKDLDKVKQIIKALSKGERKELGPRYFYDDAQYRKVLEEDDELIGFIENRATGKKGHFNLAIHPDYRGKGYAEKIVKKAVKDAGKLDLDKIYWITSSGNKASRALAEKMGFVLKKEDDDEVRYVYELD